MVNIIDLIVGFLILFYLLRNAGGLLRTLKNFLIIFLLLIFFGIVSRLVLDWSWAKPLHQTLEESYLVKLSYYLIKGVYPTVERGAPKIDIFIKKKILTLPTSEVTLPKIVLPEKSLPKLPLPELPQLK